MIALLQQLGVTWRDVFLAGVCLGVWVGNRNRQKNGERMGALEDAVAEVRGLLKAIRGNGDAGR